MTSANIDGSSNVDSASSPAAENSISLEATRSLATQALALSVQEWSHLGWGDDPLVADAALWKDDDSTKSCLDRSVDRITSLLLVRVAAIRLAGMGHENHGPTTYQYTDISTSALCRQALMADEQPWPFVTPLLLQQLTAYVEFILRDYSSTLPFHNLRHAVAVTVSCNKLLDLVLSNDDHGHDDLDGFRPMTFGLRTDPMLWFALIFAALIHDVRHQGVRNAQLVYENHPAALLYNDQSVQEKQSLQIAFDEFLKPNYAILREAIFGSTSTGTGTGTAGTDDAAYRYFRMTVVSAVMSTDLASPEQTVLTKAKWKEAFEQLPPHYQHQQHPPNHLQPNSSGRRGSLVSNISMPRVLASGRFNRRGSNVSEMSDVTMQSYMSCGPMSPLKVSRRASYSGDGGGGAYPMPRRFSVDNAAARRRMSGDSNPQQHRQQHRRQSGDFHRRRMSADGFDSPAANSARRRQLRPSQRNYGSYEDDEVNDFAIDSLDMLMDSPFSPRAVYHNTNATTTDQSVDSLVSDTVDSFAVMKKKKYVPLVTQRDDVDPDAVGSSNGRINVPEKREVTRTCSDEANESANEASTSLVSFAAESIRISQKRLDGARLTRPRAVTHKPPSTTGAGDDHEAVEANDSTILHRKSTVPPHPLGNAQYQDDGRDASGHDDESSFSLTPPSSEDEYDGPSLPNSIVRTANRAQPLTKQSVPAAPANSTTTAQDSSRNNTHVTRRASTGMASTSRFGSLADERIDEDRPNHATYRDLLQANSGETVRSTAMDSSRFRKRLGILRSMDLSGEAIEVFSRHGSSTGGVSMLSTPHVVGGIAGGVASNIAGMDEEPDYLRASTVIETLLRVADVGHFLQSWENMTLWSARMFHELAYAYHVGRGQQHDPGPSWFDNQIRIMDSYLKPLALQLDDCGVFGEFVGPTFAQNVDDLRSRWLVLGYEWTEAMREEVAAKLGK